MKATRSLPVLALALAVVSCTTKPKGPTREEVLLMLGEPDASLHGDRRFVYLWAKVVGLWFVAAGYEGDAGEIPKGYVLEIDFDARGVICAHHTRTCGMQDLFKQRVLNGIPYPADRGPPRAETHP